MSRIELSKEKFKQLFKEQSNTKQNDPELMDILQRFIFGEVFYIGELDDKIRELITCAVLSTLQTLPQLKAHTNAALNVGVTSLELREAIYQCAPFIGFPRTLNAVSTINEVFEERGINLPLENQCEIEDSERYEKGFEIQYPIYGDEIKDKYSSLPDEMSEALPRFLTEFCFGDFYTRKAIDIKTRELLILCILTTLNSTNQIIPHAIANIKLGNSKEIIYAGLIQCLPYIGFPSVFNAINAIMSIE